MIRFPSRLALCLMAGLIGQAAQAADAPPAVTVNGKPIPATRVEAVMSMQRAQGAPDTPQVREQIRENLISREVIAQEAAKKGLDKKTDVQAKMDLARQAVLLDAYMMDFVKSHPVTEAELKKEYEGVRSQVGSKEYKPRHVLVETEDEAKAIIAKLKAGEKFEALAKQSKDPGSKDNGGDLGWSTPTMYVKPFSDAMVKLEKGKYSDTPVKSDFGYHVIQLDDVRDLKAPDFNELKPQLEQRLQQQKMEAHVKELRNKAKIQ